MSKRSPTSPVLLAVVCSVLACKPDATATPQVAPTPARVPEAAPDDPLAGLDSSIEKAMKDWDVPGLSIAVVENDAVVYAKGFGVRNLETKDPVDTDTVFQIASNTKPMFSTTLGMIIAEGQLGWQDPVIEHLPDFRMHDEHATQQMQVEDLVAHHSGLGTFAGDLMWIGSKMDVGQVYPRLRHIEPSSSFRSRYGYSNLMFMVAGMIIEKKTGKSWEEQIRTRLLDPLGMKRTSTSVEALEGLDNVATPYMPVDEKLVALPFFSFDTVGPAASVNSSITDMSQWMRMQLADGKLDGQEVVPAKVLGATRIPRTAIGQPPLGDPSGRGRHFRSYGLGWFLADFSGRATISHGGGAPGMTSKVILVPEEGLGIAVLANSESPIVDIVALQALDGFLGHTDRDWSDYVLERIAAAKAKAPAESPKAEPSDPLQAKPLVGKYRNPALGLAEVTKTDEGLQLSLVDHGGLDCPLAPAPEGRLSCTWSDPIFETSTIEVSMKKDRANELKFAVRPRFIDPVVYAFTRSKR